LRKPKKNKYQLIESSFTSDIEP